MATAFRELSDSPKEHLGGDGVRFTRRFLVAWDSRWAFLRDVLGDGLAFGGQLAVNYPGFTGVKPVSFDSEPFTERLVQQAFLDVGENLNRYVGYALVTVTYGPLGSGAVEWPTSEINFPEPEVGTLSYRMSYAAASRMVAGSGLRWAGAIPSPGDPGGSRVEDPEYRRFLRMHDVVHSLTWSHVVGPPRNAIRRTINHVNQVAWRGFEPQTILFEGSEVEAEMVLPGDLDDTRPLWRVTHTFRERRIPVDGAIYGWQHDYRTDPGNEGWEVIRDADGNMLYPQATGAQLDTLFQVEQAEPQ